MLQTSRSSESEFNQASAPTRPEGDLRERLDALKLSLPESSAPYTDVYFLRSLEILSAENITPWVRAQVMIRKGPGEVGGIEEALAIIDKYSDLVKHGGRVYALEEGDNFGARETLMMIEGPIQDIVALETMYLGVLSSETTRLSDGVSEINLSEVTANMRTVVDAAEGRPVIYFGARHWRYDHDAAISTAAFEGGAVVSSTGAGSACIGKRGTGTIPHVLENVYAKIYGRNQAVVEATKAFDRVIDPAVPRIALIDYANREIDDSLATAEALGNHLWGVRVDTCGENVAQGALTSPNSKEAADWRQAGVPLPDESHPQAKYWYGTGVTVTGVYALRQALDAAGFSEVKIVLSSGFADAEKVKAFVDAEKILGVRLFDSLGVGGVYESRAAKMDIVMVGEDEASLVPVSKAGRGYQPNPRLRLMLGNTQN